MKSEEITTLAREYAEEEGKHDIQQGFGEAFAKDMLEFNEKEFKSVLEFLLRRYFLVEKSKVEQFFQSRQNILVNQDKYDRYIVDEASAEKRLMLCLFPEIAKEVER